MKTNWFFLALALILVMTLPVSPALAGAGLVFASQDADVLFNPQPEPPGQIFEFEAAGSVDGEWVGRFSDAATGVVGALEVETLSSTRLGETLYLVQLWTLFPPDPAIPVALEGSLNLTSGLLVLNGAEVEGPQAHVQGQVVFGEGGAISVGGELMFNPQPEPPGQD